MLQKHFSELFCVTWWTLVAQICKSCPFNVQILLSLSALEHFKNVIVKFRTWCWKIKPLCIPIPNKNSNNLFLLCFSTLPPAFRSSSLLPPETRQRLNVRYILSVWCFKCLLSAIILHTVSWQRDREHLALTWERGKVSQRPRSERCTITLPSNCSVTLCAPNCIHCEDQQANYLIISTLIRQRQH